MNAPIVRESFDGFIKLDGVATQSATSIDDIINNALLNLKRGLKDIIHIPGFQQIKGPNNPIALIGGGPSIRKELDNIRAFKGPIIACGSSYDWLVENGVVPNYCIVCDPDPLTKEYLKLKHKDTIFLISYACHPDVFDYLLDRTVYGWFCHSEDFYERVKDHITIPYSGISGGCTVGLRAISAAIMLGYTNQHYWGFDSCLGVDETDHHAYEFATKDEQIGDVYRIRLGDDKPDTTKTYSCAGYHLAQAHHFQSFYFQYHMIFTPTFHGEGMLTDFMNFIERIGVINHLKNEAMKMFGQRTDFIMGI